MGGVWATKQSPFTMSKQLKTKSKQDFLHPNTDVRFVRQIIDGPDRVRGVKIRLKAGKVVTLSASNFMDYLAGSMQARES